MSAKRPKLVAGLTYRFTFTPAEWHTGGPYSTVALVVDPRVTTMWVNRWCARGKHTVEIVEVEA